MKLFSISVFRVYSVTADPMVSGMATASPPGMHYAKDADDCSR